MVHYKQMTRSLEAETVSLQKQVCFLKKNIHLSQHSEQAQENRELLSHCTLLRENLKNAAMQTYNQQVLMKRLRNTIK